MKIYSKMKEEKAVNNFEKKIEKPEEIEIKAGDEIALIEIPSVGLSSVVIHSIENKYLKHYVCHFDNSPLPGEYGNFSLAGHSSNIYNNVFNDIHKVNIGDKINIKTTKDTFTYTVTEIFDTEAENIEVLNQDNEIKEITIVTCTDNGKARLIVKGEMKQ